ncbi:vitamin D3 receptor-like [Ruditapes philippinarum]|uniref:vitamin D3 receptor-like n=1 Tax=Ruditapes philippinarum TaxID=129788 RepID=UPI00295AD924|nr:vitamin D3 receptor-like [Ruditapes philippinarum]
MTEVYTQMDNSSTIPQRRKRSIDRKKVGSGNPYTSVPLPPCKVCSGNATGYHFGVITCEACKAFFRRALLHKHNYKCIKDDTCEITDKKLGNCSACRLKKCFDIGMSKGGVRRGRYSIAIRTQAILEAKAREAEATVTDPVPIKKQRLDSVNETDMLDSSPDSGIALDVFDGLLDLDLTEFTITVEDIKPEVKPAFVENHEMEFLIDAIMSCQEAVYPNLKKHYKYARVMEQQHYKYFEEFNLKEEVFGDLFGTQNSFVSTEEYQQIFAETGLDLDDRLTTFNKKGKSMEENIAQYVNFAKLVPGFKALNPKDVSRLLKAAHMEFYMLGNYMLCNGKLGVCSSADGYAVSHKVDMIKFFDKDIIETILEYSDRIKLLDLTLVEIALLRLIVLTYTDRCTLSDPQRIQHLQEKYVECLQYYLNKNSPNPGQRLYKLFNLLLSLRDVTDLNIKANKKFLNEWDFVMHDYPLWKEMLSYDGE